MAVDAKTVMTYIKVQAKAEGTTGAERDTAEKILRKMESEHPGVEKLAKAFKAAQESLHSASAAPEPPHERPVYAHPSEEDEDESGESGNWENIFRWAGKAMSNVYGFAENMAQAAVGRQLADHVTSSTRKTSAGFVILSLRMPLSAYRYAMRLNSFQKTAFRDALHDMLDDELDNFLGEED